MEGVDLWRMQMAARNKLQGSLQCLDLHGLPEGSRDLRPNFNGQFFYIPRTNILELNFTKLTKLLVSKYILNSDSLERLLRKHLATLRGVCSHNLYNPAGDIWPSLLRALIHDHRWCSLDRLELNNCTTKGKWSQKNESRLLEHSWVRNDTLFSVLSKLSACPQFRPANALTFPFVSLVELWHQNDENMGM
jgi:hypothetical protein